MIKRPFISLTRNMAILICVATIVSILFKMQEVTAVNYSYEFGIILIVAAAIEINFDFYTESTLKNNHSLAGLYLRLYYF